MLAHKRVKSQALNFAASVPMEVENGMLRILMFIFEQNGRKNLSCFISDCEINALDCVTIQGLRLWAEGSQVMRELGRANDTLPGFLISAIHPMLFIFYNKISSGFY